MQVHLSKVLGNYKRKNEEAVDILTRKDKTKNKEKKKKNIYS